MDTDKYIIIMRQEGKWYNIGDRKIGARLKDYEKKLILKNKQGGWISSNNLMLPLPATQQDVAAYHGMILLECYKFIKGSKQ